MIGPMRIGLTGGIASGKSTVAACFTQLGVPVIDADLAARRVVQPGTRGLEQVAQRFGRSILNIDGDLDRAALRSIVFANPRARKDLEVILHPLIWADMDAQVAAVEYPYVVLAIPLLVEGGSPRSRVDRVLVVDVPEDMQMDRLVRRDGCDRAEARVILESQANRSTRLAAADDLLDNSRSVAEVREAVEELHGKYLQIGLERRQGSN